ncbi:MAG: hypothetical protein IPJ88_00020 [Myxococcales bacterium]|nr:MAG: hypothetical protein IPJ88_00020 [Myxococcales bacterium]
MKRAGVASGVCFCGRLAAREIAPGDVVLPNQFIDRTMGRPSTFFGQAWWRTRALRIQSVATSLHRSPVRHESTARAYIRRARTSVSRAPVLSSRVGAFEEHRRGRRRHDELPEARLAREAELCYATLALPTDYDSWRPDDEVRVTDVLSVLMANVARAKAIPLRRSPRLQRTTAPVSTRSTPRS